MKQNDRTLSQYYFHHRRILGLKFRKSFENLPNQTHTVQTAGADHIVSVLKWSEPSRNVHGRCRCCHCGGQTQTRTSFMFGRTSRSVVGEASIRGWRSTRQSADSWVHLQLYTWPESSVTKDTVKGSKIEVGVKCGPRNTDRISTRSTATCAPLLMELINSCLKPEPPLHDDLTPTETCEGCWRLVNQRNNSFAHLCLLVKYLLNHTRNFNEIWLN